MILDLMIMIFHSGERQRQEGQGRGRVQLSFSFMWYTLYMVSCQGAPVQCTCCFAYIVRQVMLK